jgi:hypothetical protein
VRGGARHDVPATARPRARDAARDARARDDV